MVVNNIHTHLIAIGFSENEAKAYTALIKTNPATAYEIAKLSGIPTSKIYEVLSRLTDKGIVMVAGSDKKRKYIPLEPDDFINSQKSQMNNRLHALQQELHSIKHESPVSYIWNMHNYDLLIQKASEIISAAKKNILLSLWQDELLNLKDLLSIKEQAAIPVSIVHFGKIDISIGCMFQHPIEATLFSEKGGRGFLLVVDEQVAVMGTIAPDGAVEGAWSMNKGFVALAEDYIKHDIYIMKIIKRFDRKLQLKFGANYEMLRDIFNDSEV